MYDVDTALLRSFVLLAETRSFSKTAQRVGRTQSAVSAQLKKLEDLMGATLVERDTRNVALTADGERLLGYAAQIVAAADAMIQRFRTVEIEGEVRFGSPEDFASAYLPDILSAFAAAHERVLLRVSCDLTLHLIDQFERGLHDIVIVKQDPEARYPGTRALWREELVWVGTAPAVDGAAVPLVHFREAIGATQPVPLVLSPAPCVYRSRASAALDAVGVPWRVVYESPSHAGCAAAVKAGLGYSVMPRGLSPDGLAVLPDDAGWPKLPEAEICLLPAARLPPAAAALVRFIEARIVRDAPRRPSV